MMRRLLWQWCLLFCALQGPSAWAEHDGEPTGAEPSETPAPARPIAADEKPEKDMRRILPDLVDKANFNKLFEKGTTPSPDLFKGDTRWRGGCVAGDYNYGPDGKLKGRYTDTGSYWYHGANLRSFAQDRANLNGLDLDMDDDDGMWSPWISNVGNSHSVNRDLKTPVVVSDDNKGIYFNQKANSYAGKGETRVTLRQTKASDGTPMLILREDLLASEGLHFPKYCVFAQSGIPRAKDVSWED